MYSIKLPTLYLPHGGGPWPFVDLPFGSERENQSLKGYLESIPGSLPEKPRALLVISAHWEEPVPTIMTAENPPMLYDYYGFPPESYTITWPAPGSPWLAERVKGLLNSGGFKTAEDSERGFDHGTFVPLKVAFPDAEIPTTQLSLLSSLDPAAHIELGRALLPLREEGVFIIGSGMSYHDLRGLMSGRGLDDSEIFDSWLAESSTLESETRNQLLTDWAKAPAARAAHPREEHLLPLMVVAGAAGQDKGKIAFSDTYSNARISAVQFG